MKAELPSGLISIIKENFSEIANEIEKALPKEDERYAELENRQAEIEKAYPDIENWIEKEGPLSLSKEEHDGLIEYLKIDDEMTEIERLAIYYAGARDCINYLKKAGQL